MFSLTHSKTVSFNQIFHICCKIQFFVLGVWIAGGWYLAVTHQSWCNEMCQRKSPAFFKEPKSCSTSTVAILIYLFSILNLIKKNNHTKTTSLFHRFSWQLKKHLTHYSKVLVAKFEHVWRLAESSHDETKKYFSALLKVNFCRQSQASQYQQTDCLRNFSESLKRTRYPWGQVALWVRLFMISHQQSSNMVFKKFSIHPLNTIPI